jgi:hypothetical protein
MDPTATPPGPGQEPGQSGGSYQPAPPTGPAPGQTDPIVFWIGDIGVSRYWVMTPNGTAPLAKSEWFVRDHTRIEQVIPTHAIVLAVVFALFCLLGLLFLLMKEQRTVGWVEVTVRSDRVHHVTQVPVRQQAEVQGVRGLVHQAKSMAYALDHR